MQGSQHTRVLYMEDDPGAARLFQKKLERLGYAVDVAPNGEEGLIRFSNCAYDLIAVDQRMPIHDGLEVIRILAQRGPLPPTIMITGAGDEKVAVEAMKLGAGDYIVKDVEGGYLELLPAVIEQLLQKQRLIEERKQALDSLERRNRDLATLNEVGQALTSTLNVEQIIEQLLPSATEVTHAEASSIWLWQDGAKTTLACRGIYSLDEYTPIVPVSLSAGEGLVGWAAHRMGPFSPADPRGYPDTEVYPDLEVMSLLVVPLILRDAVIGVLQVANKRDGGFNDDDRVLLETLAASAAIAIDNARLVEALRDHAEDLRSRNEELDAFSHMVAHDLKNPLSLTIGYAQFLRKRHTGTLEEDSVRCLEQIEQSGYKMRNIIDELLLLAKIRHTDVTSVPLDMEDIVSMAELRLSSMIQDYNAQVNWPDSWPKVMGEEAWVEEVWVNYISNALKYGGRPPVIELGWDALDNGMAKFWVRDNGAGLLPEQQARLFTPFTRLNQVRVEGHGLGLSIVRRIVEKLGGEVGIDSAPGKGSAFSFTLPLMPN
ncbi:MAG: response regulator [Anaerolineae bacterium]|nr:response regulator [Anaerolineae bacterium]